MESCTLHKILESFNAPINEDQAWAVCFQCAKFVQNHHSLASQSNSVKLVNRRQKLEQSNSNDNNNNSNQLITLNHVVLGIDGNILALFNQSSSVPNVREKEIVRSLGITLFQALDFGLSENEEQKLSSALESLIGQMTGEGGTRNQDGDEGIVDDDKDDDITIDDVIEICSRHIGKDVDVAMHCKAVCRALVHESAELSTFLERVVSEHEKLNELCEEKGSTDSISTLQRRDWARLWMQVMNELRLGVKLKTVQSTINHPLEYELTPYEILMDDIRIKRYTLNKTFKSVDSYPVKVKKDVHEIILDFIRSRPPLQPVGKRVLSALSDRGHLDPRQELLLSIRNHPPKLRPTPGRTGRNDGIAMNEQNGGPVKKVIKPDLKLLAFNNSDDEDNDSFDGYNKDAGGDDGDDDDDIGVDDNDDDKNKVSASLFTPLTPLSPQSPPKHLPWQHTALDLLMLNMASPWKPVRRHSITVCETARVFKNFPLPKPLASSSASSSSSSYNKRVGCSSSSSSSSTSFQNQIDNFMAPDFHNMTTTMECLSLTIEEVMHIRGVLTKAELECLSTHTQLREMLEAGKLCFTCKKVKFSLFGPWSIKCKFCNRNVCSHCSSKMRIPTEHFEHIPVYTLNPSLSSSSHYHCFDNSLSGSAPSSPVREIKNNNHKNAGSRLQKTTSFDVAPNLSTTTTTAANNSNHSSHRRTLIQPPPQKESILDQAKKTILLRSSTLRPFASSSSSSSSLKSQLLESGPLMNICNDCKNMVISIIRASRRCLSMIGRQDSKGRGERAYSAHPTSSRKKSFKLDLVRENSE
ncbi:hypothetical protein HELRODRAFT_192317 [Helobdella robusta]|uniref:KIND domain-containing protein n=1 Tax=Helobdella robusta TaxID=6412 RepID=T1FTT8_HELRO|nr:hypothetical protein HELRODRAFT_192317 [Helobdella robusta]ESO01371.1 hypothetical protein HELRODRAFT_192317 [Helobdella robusta]